jgi:hypothetical protein
MSISCSPLSSPNAIVSNIKTAAGKGAPVPTRPQPSRDMAPVTTANGLVHYSERYRVFSASDSIMAGLDAFMVLDSIYCDPEYPSTHARTIPDYCAFGTAVARGILSKQERGIVLCEVLDQ